MILLKKYIFLLCFLIFVPFYSWSQSDFSQQIEYYVGLYKQDSRAEVALGYLDSAMTYANALNSAAVIAEIEEYYGGYYGYYNKEKSVYYYQRAKEKFISLDDTVHISRCFQNLGNRYFQLGELDSAKWHYKKAIILKEAIRDTNGIAYGYNGLGLVEKQKGNYSVAIDYYLKAVKLIKGERPKGVILMNIGLLYKIIENKEAELEYLELALDHLQDEAAAWDRQKCLSNIGEYYLRDNQYDLADSYMVKAIGIATELKDTISIGIGNNNLGAMHYDRGAYKKAISAFEGVVAISHGKEYMKTNLAFAKEHLGLISIKSKKCRQGIILIKESIQLFEETSRLRMKEQALMDLADSYAECGDFQLAFDAHKDYFEFYDTLRTESKQKNVEEIHAKYKKEIKEAENASLKKENDLQLSTIQNQRLSLAAGLGGFCLLGYISFTFFQRGKERKKHIEILSEKNTSIQLLHQELDHRVKNNMTLVANLMKMQIGKLKSAEAKQALIESEGRLGVISLVHQKLSIEKESKQISLKEYITQLSVNLINTFPVLHQIPEINLNLKDIKIRNDKAVWIGLIINELITNSLKYAFEDHNNPVITIQMGMNEEGKLKLHYRDNGNMKFKFDQFNKTRSLGLDLMKTLTQQLKGSIAFEYEKGASFQFLFENPKNL